LPAPAPALPQHAAEAAARLGALPGADCRLEQQTYGPTASLSSMPPENPTNGTPGPFPLNLRQARPGPVARNQYYPNPPPLNRQEFAIRVPQIHVAP
jgi:hypothetical protein